MSMYNLIEYSNNYAKTLGSLLQYHEDKDNDNINDAKLFELKVTITGRTPVDYNKLYMLKSRCH